MGNCCRNNRRAAGADTQVYEDNNLISDKLKSQWPLASEITSNFWIHTIVTSAERLKGSTGGFSNLTFTRSQSNECTLVCFGMLDWDKTTNSFD